MTDKFTTKGHRLTRNEGNLVFKVEVRTLQMAEIDGAPTVTKLVDPPWLLSQLELVTPMTLPFALKILRAWLGAFEDDELLAQADELLDLTWKSVPPAPGGPQQSPPKGAPIN